MSADEPVGFTIVRMLDATPRQVWRMWTEPSELTHWLHPDGAVTPTATIQFDVRVGRRLGYTMVDEATGKMHAISGVFQEVDPHRRLVFTWGPADRQDDDDITVISVDLVDRGGRTELTLDVRGVRGVAADEDVRDGWDRALRLLAERVST